MEVVLRAAFQCAEDGEWANAAELLRDALLEDLDDLRLLNWLGLVELELDLEGLARERFRRALDVGPDDSVLLTTAGTALAAVDDPSAEPALRTTTLLAPHMPEVR